MTTATGDDFESWLAGIRERVAAKRGSSAGGSRVVEWKRKRLAKALIQIASWSRQRNFPVTYSCNDSTVWPTTTKGLSSLGDRDDKTGLNELLDLVAAAARRDRTGGWRFQIMGDGAYWIESGRQFLSWKYVDLDAY